MPMHVLPNLFWSFHMQLLLIKLLVPTKQDALATFIVSIGSQVFLFILQA